MEAKPERQNSLGSTVGEDIYKIRPSKRRDSVDLINNRFRYGPICYTGPDAVRDAIAYAKKRSRSRSRRAIIHVLDESGAVNQMFVQRRFIRSPRS